MSHITTTENNTLAMSGASSTGLVLSNDTMEKAFRMAELMASGRSTVPKHLQGSVADCMAVTLQALQWNMSPFAVAQKTHLVNGTLGYEAQLVNAVLQSTGAIVSEFEYEFKGSGEEMSCRVGAVPRGKSAITWGEWLCMKVVTTRNSPLWKTNPKQQMGYLQVKNWARLYKPGAILGVYTADELQEPSERFMGPAEVVAPTEYPQADFGKNLSSWAKVVASGRKTLQDLIAMVGSKAPLTPAQQQALADAVQQLQANTVDAAPAASPAPARPAAEPQPDPAPPAAGPTITFAQVSAKLAAAKDLDELFEAADLIGEVADPQHRTELAAVFDERQRALEQS